MIRWIVSLGLGSVMALAQAHCSPPADAQAPALPAHLLEGMGESPFPISTKSAEAQKFFNQGMAQMHSFWAREAERSFRQAAQLDPTAPMPWWGIALAAGGDYRPAFQQEFIDEVMTKDRSRSTPRSWAAAQYARKLAAVPGKATAFEKTMIESIAIRRDPATKNADDAYIAALRKALLEKPDHVEALLILSLSLMRGFQLPERTPRAGSEESMAILTKLLKVAPEHPGVHHYIIHGWEGSKVATDAWASSEKYPHLAPRIPHALHMPGHIFAQTGRWADAIKAFADAAVLEREYMKKDAIYGNGHHGHNVHYLATAYSFSGEYSKALAAAEELLAYSISEADKKKDDNIYGAWFQGWLALQRTLVQFEKWDEILAPARLPELSMPRFAAWRSWSIALALANTGQAAKAKEEAERMDAAMAEYSSRRKLPPPEELIVAREELRGHILLAEGALGLGFEHLREASRKERMLRYTEPNWYPRPVAESWGLLALRLGRITEAEEAFAIALQQYPNAARPLAGMKEIALRKATTSAQR
jgi:tetratricopeptide (TPR) repeat protein